MVRAKMKCVGNEPTNKDRPQDGNSITLDAVIGGSPENDSFFRWTPSGSVKMHCVNEVANKQFESGKEYYVDFSEA